MIAIGVGLGALLGIVMGLIPMLGLEVWLTWSYGALRAIPVELAVGLIVGATLTYRVIEEARMSNPALFYNRSISLHDRPVNISELVENRVFFTILTIVWMGAVYLTPVAKELLKVGNHPLLITPLILIAIVVLVCKSRSTIKAIGYIIVASLITWHLKDMPNGMLVLGNSWLIGPAIALNLFRRKPRG